MEDVFKEILLLLVRIYFDLLALVVLILYVLPKSLLIYLGRAVGLLSKPQRSYKSVLITGASVGIGAGLAKSYAKAGVHLTLTAYSKGSLEETAAACKELGAIVSAQYVDVKDAEAMAKLIKEADKRAPLDLVIANAGVTARIDGLKDSPWVFDTNMKGMLNTVLPTISVMRPRKVWQACSNELLGRPFRGDECLHDALYCYKGRYQSIW